MSGEIEGFRLNGISISDLLLPDFVKKLQEAKLNMEAISLAFVKVEGSENNKLVIPFIIHHQNSQEVKDKIIHLGGGNEKDLKILSDILTGITKKK